jgi:hypothetical protein
MAEGDGGESFLAFVVGGLVVVVAVLGVVIYTGGHFGGSGPTKTVNINVPSTSR